MKNSQDLKKSLYKSLALSVLFASLSIYVSITFSIQLWKCPNKTKREIVIDYKADWFFLEFHECKD